jgi:hypothetical protein
MDYIVNHIKNENDLFELPKIYKTIDGLRYNELVYYVLFMNNTNKLDEILEFVSQKYYRDSAIIEKVCDDDEKIIISLKLDFGEENVSKGIFFKKKDSPFLYLLTDIGRKKNLLERFLHRSYPLLERVSLPSKQIIVDEIIKGILDEGYKITSSMVSEKKWWEMEKIKSSLDYPTDVPIERVVEDLKGKAFINSILLNIYTQSGLRICKLFVSRKGIIKYIDGSFEIFKEKVLDRVFNKVSLNYDSLEGREQVEDSIKPIIVTFENPKNEPQIMINQFINTLRNNKSVSLMTHHNGNPFFFADVSDIKEGSFFGVMFESKKNESKMTIIPQEISSQIALSNFISYVFNKFGEGNISFKDD